jgi:hypothetical protein
MLTWQSGIVSGVSVDVIDVSDRLYRDVAQPEVRGQVHDLRWLTNTAEYHPRSRSD